MRNGLRIAIGLALAGAAPLAAQTPDPARALTTHIATLASDARNVAALVGAGEAALALGDASAAVGFFGRADEIDPRDRRVKLGLGRAALMLERPYEALRQFDKAKDLGVPETDFAADRGLAHDLRGDQRRAQRDYQIAMRARADAETTRRLALSLAITGDKAGALALLDPLCARQDRAAWRARAFVLAMTGDVAGANGVTRTVMPQLAGPMAPFFTRLESLSSAQKAQAVHFGTMPSDGRDDGLVYAAAGVQPSGADGALVPTGAPLGQRATTPVPRLSADPRRRPGIAEPLRLAGSAIATPSAAGLVADKAVVPVQPAAPSAVLVTRSPVIAPTGFAPATPAPVPTRQLTPPAPALVQPAAPASPAPSRTLAEIVGGLELEPANVVAAPVPAARKPQPKPAALKPVADKRVAAEKKPKVEKPDPAKLHPARAWAQLATGERKVLAYDFTKFAKKSPAAFKGVTAHTAPFRSSARLLAGPFDSEKKAQDFIRKAGVDGFVWTSPAGTAVEKLALK